MHIFFKFLIILLLMLLNIGEIKIGGEVQFLVDSVASSYCEKQKTASGRLYSARRSSQGEPSVSEEIGFSVRRKAIRAFFWGHGNTYVYILGAIHGNESNSQQLVEWTRNLLEKNINQKNKAVTFIMIPCLNPDGTYVNHRTNANNVDLNRNFPFWDFDDQAKCNRYYRSSLEVLQPEILALLQLCKTYPPALIYSIHQPLNLINYDGPAETIALDVQHISGMRIESDIGYTTSGSLGTYFSKVKKIPVITLELPYTGKGKDWEDLLHRNAEAIIYATLNWYARRTK